MAVAIIISILLSSFSLSASSELAAGCFKSIIGLGDSMVDTGNLVHLSPPNKLPSSALPPYGETFFHRPTGRYSDGRLIIDFIAESLGLPLVQPYFGGENATVNGRRFDKGVNFAVGDTTALDSMFFEKLGIPTTSNMSLRNEMDWFKQFLATIPEGRKYLQNSLVLVGKVGVSDYYFPLMQGASAQVIQSFASKAVDFIGSTIIEELIKLGAETILVSGDLPLGCVPYYLTNYKESSTKNDYDPKTGCLKWFNKVAWNYNELLQKELSRRQKLYPHATIMYADCYSSAMRFFISPNKFGFSKESILKACCGAGGPYNFNASAWYGTPPAVSCEDPSSFVSWDALHLTEAAFRLISQDLLQQLYSAPRIRAKCPSMLFRPAAQVYEY